MQDSNPRRRVRSPSGYPDYPNRPFSLGTHLLLQLVGRVTRLQWGPGQPHLVLKKAVVSVVETQRCLSLQPMSHALWKRQVCTPMNSVEMNLEFAFYSMIQPHQPVCFSTLNPTIHKHPVSVQSMRIARSGAGHTV